MDGYAFAAYFSTIANAVCGSIIMIFYLLSDPLDSVLATRLLVLGASFDAIDGRLARRSKYKFQIGAKLDTYADLVTFGLVPAFMILEIVVPYNSLLAWITASFYVLTASFRLSRFVIARKSLLFSGMPSPPAAIFIASLYVIDNIHPQFMVFSAILISSLMMSSLPFTGMKKVTNLFDWIHFIYGIVLMLLMTYAPSSWFNTLGILFASYIYYFIIVGPFHAKWQLNQIEKRESGSFAGKNRSD